MIMRNRFDRQLALLDENMIRMGELCELAINRVIKALTGGSVEEARAVIEADDEIDHMEKDIERLCLKLLLQQQPVAKDLRRISAALKMITDMERIGDQTADIADIVIAANMCEVQDVRDITIMADEAGKMVRDSVAAYVEKDLEKARQVMKSDDVVDDLFEKIRGELIAFIAEKQGKDGSEVIDLLMISKYLERIGDHATNIAEWVEFSITGVHKGGEKI
ncbi:phosphate transport system regulatory protein PhoU [Mediterraneibacter butyricigenes]|uniref:Phosphate-specific transport system accessory protein PhoU n=2 Tax=Mediterraneibacter butyricigenes TaxID=2316025 RepID=A0A391P2F3_9FIRM|nr:phosphate transport system regulatory protein PhoU [Mediterraneibacter butyricigenes]